MARTMNTGLLDQVFTNLGKMVETFPEGWFLQMEIATMITPRVTMTTSRVTMTKPRVTTTTMNVLERFWIPLNNALFRDSSRC